MNDHCRPSAAYSSWRKREGVILQQRAPELRTLCLGQLIQVLSEELIPAQLQVNTKLEKKKPTWGYSTPGSFWVWIRTCWNNLSEDLGTPWIYQSELQGCFREQTKATVTQSLSWLCWDFPWRTRNKQNSFPGLGHSPNPAFVCQAGLHLKQSLIWKEVQRDPGWNNWYNIYAELQDKLSAVFNKHELWAVIWKASCQKLAQHSH